MCILFKGDHRWINLNGDFNENGDTKNFYKIGTNSVAGAIAGILREQSCVEMQAIGAGAINQAIKSIAIARGYLAPSGIDIVCIPSFSNIVINDEDRTAIKLLVEVR